jgi:hypothetical protein
MILVIVLGVAGLWLAGNDRPVGWGLTAAAHLLWLPYALAAGQPGFALAVAGLGLVCLVNYRMAQTRAGRLLHRWHGPRHQ